jgi:transcriptional regulator with XRE-family HTH domain
MSLGQRIALLRQQRELTLQDVAAGSGLTSSFLSRLERDQANISVANLRKLGQFFDVPMIYFFTDEAAGPAAIVVRASERPRLSQPGDTAEISALAPRGSQVEARLIEAPPGATGLANSAQLTFVISGRLRWEIGAEAYMLDAGDTLLVRHSVMSAWECVGSERAVAVLMWAVS